LLKSVLSNAEIAKYLPDKSGKAFKVDQQFIQRFFRKLEPEYFAKIVEAARNARVY
jgi:hypothetical protein